MGRLRIQAPNHLGLCGCVLDTKFGRRYDVTKPLVLLRWKMCRSNDFTSTTAHLVLSPCHFSQCFNRYWLHRARKPWILEHPCESWLWDVPNIQILVAQPRTSWALAHFCVFGSPSRKPLFLVGNKDNRDSHRIARKCAETGGRCSVSGQRHVHPKASASRSRVLFIT